MSYQNIPNSNSGNSCPVELQNPVVRCSVEIRDYTSNATIPVLISVVSPEGMRKAELIVIGKIEYLQQSAQSTNTTIDGSGYFYTFPPRSMSVSPGNSENFQESFTPPVDGTYTITVELYEYHGKEDRNDFTRLIENGGAPFDKIRDCVRMDRGLLAKTRSVSDIVSP